MYLVNRQREEMTSVGRPELVSLSYCTSVLRTLPQRNPQPMAARRCRLPSRGPSLSIPVRPWRAEVMALPISRTPGPVSGESGRECENSRCGRDTERAYILRFTPLSSILKTVHVIVSPHLQILAFMSIVDPRCLPLLHCTTPLPRYHQGSGSIFSYFSFIRGISKDVTRLLV